MIYISLKTTLTACIVTAIVRTKLYILLLSVLVIQSALSAEQDSRITAQDLATHYGFPTPTRVENAIKLKSKYSDIQFNDNSRKMLFNGTLIWLNDGTSSGENLSISSADADLVIDPLLRSKDALKEQRAKTVLLDPGHGGHKRGAIPKSGSDEKVLVLDIARRVQQKLKALNTKCLMTRDKDVFLDLRNRADIARRKRADILISIHLNFAESSIASGIETYILSANGFPSTSGGEVPTTENLGNKHDKANMILAYHLHRSLLKATLTPDRGIRRARYGILKNAPCPAVLIECGFLSNEGEAGLLETDQYRNGIADAITLGIATYINNSKLH